MPTDYQRADDVFTVDTVSLAYNDRFPALQDISFSVHRGERLAFVGANGCGKSTLLKVLAGLLFPDSGTVNAFGQPLTEEALEDRQFNSAFRGRVGFVFQNSDAQVFSPTVRDEIAFGPLNMGLERSEIEHRITGVVEMLGISDLCERAPYQLSGGQKKRVAIASVLVMNPSVLIFDEPTAALDPRTQHWLMELMNELSASGKTIVLATHDLDSLPVLADRCIVISEEHRIAAILTPSELLNERQLLLDVNLVHELAQ